MISLPFSSNNTNKLSPQELVIMQVTIEHSSNNTNKLSPQELSTNSCNISRVQIIQINLVLKNVHSHEATNSTFK